MGPSLLDSLVFLFLFIARFTSAQSSTASAAASGYTGYSLSLDGDPNSVVYATDDTLLPANASTTNPPPDVYLNASVSVGEIDITVSNLTAKINLAAQVLNLLQFNAGVDLSIDKVELTIQNVTAKVLLEARLENLVLMIDDVLSSLDLNPVLATLGTDVGTIVNDTASVVSSAVGSTSTVAARGLALDLAENILYSTNDYSGNTHTNRILEQNGNVVDQFLNNNGIVSGTKFVGTYIQLMTFNGYNVSAVRNGQAVRELEYVYTPFNGLTDISAIFVDATGKVVATQVLSESSAGGSSTID